MIEVTSIKWKNLFSYGKKWTEYPVEVGVTRITGINGSGKSTFVDALNYVLYGKPFRKINLPTMVNTTNKKEMVVELEFTKGKSNYKIVRGMKPNIFEIYKDEELIDQDAHSKKYQEMLEEDILGFDESIFNQIAVKSLTKFDSFLNLTKAKKREVVEQVFDIIVIGEMANLNKVEKSAIKSTINDLEKELYRIETLMEQELENLEKLKIIQKNIEKEKAEEKQKYKDEIEVLGGENLKLEKGVEIIKVKETERKELAVEATIVDNKIFELEKQKRKLEARDLKFDAKIKWLKEQCPTCLRVDEIELQHEDTDNKDKKLAKIAKKIEALEEESYTFADDLSRLDVIIQKKAVILQKIKGNTTSIKELQKKVDKKPKKEVIVNYDKYNEYKEKKTETDKYLAKVNEELKYSESIFELLNDKGFKAYIISKYLPLVNKLLNTYLQKFGIELEMAFNSDLDIDVKTPLKDKLAYDNFSSGEKKRIDAAIMLCFLEFTKLKYNTAKINVLVFDEFTVGLDSQGEEVFYSILKELSEKNNLEIIIVYHAISIDPENIDRVFEAYQGRGFSQFELIESE